MNPQQIATLNLDIHTKINKVRDLFYDKLISHLPEPQDDDDNDDVWESYNAKKNKQK